MGATGIHILYDCTMCSGYIICAVSCCIYVNSLLRRSIILILKLNTLFN